ASRRSPGARSHWPRAHQGSSEPFVSTCSATPSQSNAVSRWSSARSSAPGSAPDDSSASHASHRQPEAARRSAVTPAPSRPWSDLRSRGPPDPAAAAASGRARAVNRVTEDRLEVAEAGDRFLDPAGFTEYDLQFFAQAGHLPGGVHEHELDVA